MLGGLFLRFGEKLHKRSSLSRAVVLLNLSRTKQVVDGYLFRPDFDNDKPKMSIHLFALKDIQASREVIVDSVSKGGKMVQDIKSNQIKRQEYVIEPDDRIERRKSKEEESKINADGKRVRFQYLPMTKGKVLVSSGKAFNAVGLL